MPLIISFTPLIIVGFLLIGECVSFSDLTTPRPCPVGYEPYLNACFMITNTTFTWSEALSHCRESYAGADLVSIHSEVENFVFAELCEQQGHAWIGLNNLNTGSYNWTDGWPVLYTEWGYHEPSQSSGGCVSMHDNGKWYDDYCSNLKKAICKYTTETPTTTPSPPDGVCPGHDQGTNFLWEKFNRYCYYFESAKRLPWTKAQLRCKELGGMTASLASIHDSQENDFIQTRVFDNGYDSWIGLYQKQGGTYHWNDGSPLQFQRWYLHEPSSSGEQCVEMYAGSKAGFWNDATCDFDRGFVCKSELVEPPEDTHIHLGICPEHWQSRGSDCYFFEPNVYVTWDAAQTYCKEYHNEATVASVLDHYENSWIQSHMWGLTHMPEHVNYWIGLHKDGPVLKGYKFQWTDNSELHYVNWADGEPNDSPGYKNCIEANINSGFWRSVSCVTYHGYVCKMSRESNKGISGGQIAGIVIGILLGVAVIIGVIIFRAYIKKSSQNINHFDEFSNLNNELADLDS